LRKIPETVMDVCEVEGDVAGLARVAHRGVERVFDISLGAEEFKNIFFILCLIEAECGKNFSIHKAKAFGFRKRRPDISAYHEPHAFGARVGGARHILARVEQAIFLFVHDDGFEPSSQAGEFPLDILFVLRDNRRGGIAGVIRRGRKLLNPRKDGVI